MYCNTRHHVGSNPGSLLVSLSISWLGQCKTEQIRARQNKARQRKAEQNKSRQSGSEESKAEKSRRIIERRLSSLRVYEALTAPGGLYGWRVVGAEPDPEPESQEDLD